MRRRRHHCVCDRHGCAAREKAERTRIRRRDQDEGRARVNLSLESSLTLLTRAKAGDRDALETLLERYRPRLRRWAHRRLPAWARDLTDTDDLVQETMVKTIRNLDRFDG